MTVGCGVRVAGCGLRVAGCGVRVARCGVWGVGKKGIEQRAWRVE